MSSETVDNDEKLLPHHIQQPLCTTRLPYRQGRKLTAVKVYSINTESNHLLIFGVPSLNLRQETKALFLKFGKILQFNLMPERTVEQFTDTYHATYDTIQSARIAKRMLDTKNFYGGCLHICYAPEFETVEETKRKLLQRQNDVTYRLRNLQKSEKSHTRVESEPNIHKTNMVDTHNNQNNEVQNIQFEIDNAIPENDDKVSYITHKSDNKINMGEVNTISFSAKPSLTVKRKKKDKGDELQKKLKAYIEETNHIEVIDCSSTERETITNINEGLNYNKFGNELVRKVPEKPLNRIKFNINKTVNLIPKSTDGQQSGI